MGRTNVVIDDRLIAKVIALTGAKSKKEAINISLKRVVDQSTLIKALRKIKGTLKWEGNLERWRKLEKL
ncbi:MAG: type II toxin-antitoxin system VapB family antitoxin [Bdellovibrio sp.]|nr:type II toxin-antitoxin system VapB family antitoxin [Bdellovibrio sp.]